MKRGINLLIIGDPVYSRWAANMAISLKYHSPELPINLIYEEHMLQHIPPVVMDLFDIKTKIAKDHCYVLQKPKSVHHTAQAKLEPGRAKLHLYQYLAFDENIYFDVDGLCVAPIEPLFREYRDEIFGSHYMGKGVKTESEYDMMVWATAKQVWDHWKLNDDAVLPFINSSFIYIKKHKETEDLYAKALANIENPIPQEKLPHKWGTAQPDELYMNVALAQKGWMIKRRKPMYFSSGSCPPLSDIVKSHYVLGLYGDENWTSSKLTELYDRCCHKYTLEMLKKNIMFKAHQLMRGKFIVTNRK